MFIRFFQKSFASQYSVIIVTGLLLWGKAFFTPPVMPAPSGVVPLYALLYTLLNGIPLLSAVLGFLLTLASAFLLNDLLTRNNILLKNSSLAAFIFVILASYYPAFLTLHPVNICIFLLLMILRTLMGSYDRNEFLDLTYSAGFLTAIGALFYQPFLFFTILLFVALILFRSTGWRDYLTLLIGLATPFIFLGVYYFWFDRFMARTFIYLHSYAIHFKVEYVKGTIYFILTGILLLLMIIGLISGFGRFSEKTIEIRSKAYLVNWVFLVVLFSAPFANINLSFHFLLMIIPLSSVYTAFMLRLRKPFWQELAFLFFFLFILVHNSLYEFF
ncbi:MAG TPA: hypothetical protein VMC08_04345 [Bacteroidales bacterium]|nr:hypothetical protein [Bacteroidales bacterium]